MKKEAFYEKLHINIYLIHNKTSIELESSSSLQGKFFFADSVGKGLKIAYSANRHFFFLRLLIFSLKASKITSNFISYETILL